MTTITTVGYGDISGTNTSEKYVSNLIMVLGVILFSLISTEITFIIQNYDNINSDEKEQRAILDNLVQKYGLSKRLQSKLIAYIKSDVANDELKINDFIDNLPIKYRNKIIKK